jgi:hypothetical protein
VCVGERFVKIIVRVFLIPACVISVEPESYMDVRVTERLVMKLIRVL